jgi:hypothetical protein
MPCCVLQASSLRSAIRLEGAGPTPRLVTELGACLAHLGRYHANVNGLVLLGKSEPETINFHSKYVFFLYSFP